MSFRDNSSGDKDVCLAASDKADETDFATGATGSTDSTESFSKVASKVSQVIVTAAVVADAELLNALRKLVPQLSTSASELRAYDLEDIVDSQALTLLVARIDGIIVGILVVVTFRLPTGVRAWIEDVVVDGSARGKGVGTALVEAALKHARNVHATSVDLTSRPSRIEANRLYQRLGFRQRETNVYRFDLGN